MDFTVEKTSAKVRFFGFITRKSKIKLFMIAELVLLIIGICIGVFVFCSRFQKIDSLAYEKLSSAYVAFAQDDHRLGVALLDETITKFPKTFSAYRARLDKADILTKLCAYDDALNLLNETLNAGKPDVIKPLAGVRIIYAYDSKKDYFNAIIASKEFIDKYPDHFLVKDIYLNLAEYYLISGSKDEAVKVFNEVLINFPATKAAEKAQNRINEIK
jgi:tetratricopeptide (TPR) repeat protein